MANINIQAYQVYHLNHDTEEVTLQDMEDNPDDILNYLTTLFEEVCDDERSQGFTFVSDTEEVPSCIDNIVNREPDWEQDSGLKIARRLFRIEEQAQERVKAISTINKGSMLIIDGYQGGNRIFIITKVHHDKYLDDEDFSFQFGLPVNKNRLQKSCIIILNDNNEFEEIRLSDSSSVIAKYWWQDFLATTPSSSSAKNTKLAYNEIVKVVSKNIKKLSNQDYWLIRNEINSYFSNNQGFVLSDLCDRIGDYRAESDEVKKVIPNLKEELRNLPSKLPAKRKFDKQFELDIIEIKSKLRRKVVLSDKIDLIINGPIHNMRNIIQTGSDEEGMGKYVKIYSESGYDAFSDIDDD